MKELKTQKFLIHKELFRNEKQNVNPLQHFGCSNIPLSDIWPYNTQNMFLHGTALPYMMFSQKHVVSFLPVSSPVSSLTKPTLLLHHVFSMRGVSSLSLTSSNSKRQHRSIV